jgi:hypothetical protein
MKTSRSRDRSSRDLPEGPSRAFGPREGHNFALASPKSGGSTRSAGTEAMPQGFADAVAEYFRKLSSSK